MQTPRPRRFGALAILLALMLMTTAMSPASMTIDVAPLDLIDDGDSGDDGSGEDSGEESGDQQALTLDGDEDLCEIWVHGLDGDDSASGSEDEPVATITQAVALLGAECESPTIKVKPAPYVEDVDLDVPDLVLRAVDDGGGEPAADQTWGGSVVGVFVVLADGVTIKGFHFLGPGSRFNNWAAIWLASGEGTVVTDNVIDLTAEVALHPIGVVTEASGDTISAEITSNTISAYMGVYANAGADLRILDNEITNAVHAAIAIDSDGVIEIIDNTIAGPVPEEPSGEVQDEPDPSEDSPTGYGIELHRFGPGSVIRENSFEGLVGPALAVLGAGVEAVDARGNWWNAESGPVHPDNPDGEGERVRDLDDPDDPVDVLPWCLAEACDPVAAITGKVTNLPDDAESFEIETDPPAVRDATTIEGTTGHYEAWVEDEAWLEAPEPGTTTVTVTAIVDGFTRAIVEVEVSPFELVEADFDLLPEGNGAVTGTVLDDEDKPIDGASVTATTVDDDMNVGSTNTDEFGNYTLHVPAGDLTVTADEAEHEADTQPVTVVTGWTVEIDFSLVPFGYIQGQVSTDEGSDDPLEGAIVTAVGEDEPGYVSEATGENGSYSVAAPAGIYTVTARADGYKMSTLGDVEVTSRGTTSHSFFLEPFGSITGQVVDAVTEQPVTDATVAPMDTDGQPFPTAETDDTGAFILDLPAGDYDLAVTADDYEPGAETGVEVQSDNETDLGEAAIALTPTGAVAGTVTDAGSRAVVAGASVTLTDVNSTTTDTSGDYAFAGLPVGEYTLRVTQGGYRPSTRSVTVTHASTTTADVSLRPVARQTDDEQQDDEEDDDDLEPPEAAAAPAGDSPTERVAGADRASTAVAVSRSTFDPGVSTVYLATAGGFADALAGGPAAARSKGPVLLVDRDRVPKSTRAELRRLRPERLIVLGGSGAVSHEVEQDLQDSAPLVQRLAGPDRFATAAAVSQASFSPDVDVVYISTGGGFADALSGGAAAADRHAPVLLVADDEAPSVTLAELDRLAPARVVVLGGSAAVSPTVEAQLAAATGAAIERLAGVDRYDTSARVSAATFPRRVDVAYVATGENFPDALAGVPAAALSKAPLLLVRRDEVPGPVAEELRRLRPGRIVVLGGDGAVSSETERLLEAFARD